MLFVCYPKCTTCQKARAFLEERAIPYEFRDIKLDNPKKEELREWQHTVSYTHLDVYKRQAKCRGGVGEGISMPVSPPVLAAMRHVVCGDARRLFSFRLDSGALEELAGVSEAYLLTQLERGFRTLDFYKQMILPAGPDR